MNTKNFTEKEVYELARKAYEEDYVNFHINRQNCALLVIDMQNEFVKPGWTPYWVPEATKQIPKIKKLILNYSALQLPKNHLLGM